MTEFVSEPAYAVVHEKYNEHNYPYDYVDSFWQTPEQAYEAITAKMSKPKIAKRRLKVQENGRIIWVTNMTVYVDGKWVEEYDPRNSDPEFQKYLELKRKFEDE